MEHKKTLAGIVLASYIAIASTFGFGQYKPQDKIRFSLAKYDKAQSHHLHPNYFQQHRKMREGYRMMCAPGDNMPIIVPDMSKYPMHMIKPGPEWYGDDKFDIQPGPQWRLPRGWLKKAPYAVQPDKHSPRVLLYEWKHK
jgi:hypothetical protein